MKSKKNTEGNSIGIKGVQTTGREAQTPVGKATHGDHTSGNNEDAGSTGWQFVVVLAVIAIGVVALLVKAMGIF